MAITVYGISSCDSCRKARKWLDAEGKQFQWVDLRQAPPTAAMTRRWVETLGSKALRNTSGGAYRALGDEKKTWSEARWAEAFADDAMLIKRPVLVIDGEAVTTGFDAQRWAKVV